MPFFNHQTPGRFGQTATSSSASAAHDSAICSTESTSSPLPADPGVTACNRQCSSITCCY